MPVPNTPAVPKLPPELDIVFSGRTLRVKMPSAEQLMIWKRTLRQIQDAETWNAEQAMNKLERSRRVVDIVMVNPADVEWLDDEMLAGTIDLMTAFGIINQTVAAFAAAAEAEAEAEGNRETRRAVKKTAPAKKATRKATPR